MKKYIGIILTIVLLLLSLSSCSVFNKAYNGLAAYEKESYKCIEGNKIWILEKGNDEGIAVTSQIVGACQ